MTPAAALFAATPPLESLKFMFSRCMTGDHRAPADVKVLGFYDISRVHFTALRVALLLSKCHVKTTSASQFWRKPHTERRTPRSALMLQVKKATTASHDMSVFRHGGDFVVSGTRTQQAEFEEQLSKHLIVKQLATLGQSTAQRSGH